MEAYFSREVMDGLNRARTRAERRASRLSVHMGDEVFPISKLKDSGFSVEAESVPPLRGFVDLYDGSRQLAQCLIIRSEEDGPQIRYEFKRRTDASDQAPLDYELDDLRPLALLR